VRLTTQFHLLLRLHIKGAIPPHPLRTKGLHVYLPFVQFRSCILTTGIVTSEINDFTNVCEEKTFEMSLIDLPTYKINIAGIYRSPESQPEQFMKKLELVIQKLLNKSKILILCGDWNIDFLREDNDKKDLMDLLLRYNLENTVKSPTRITPNTKTLLDVIIINKAQYTTPATIVELGLSDHQAQMLPVLNKS
jgi:hypothetical protein